MSPSSPPQVPGYDVLAPLGEGASSTVWRGRRLADGMAVALKVIQPVRGEVDAALREAGLLAAVRHRHVVHLYDVLPLPAEGADRPRSVVLVTQLAAGGSLGQLLSRRRILSPGELVTVLQPLAGALADLHLRGVVHGDLSTGNILFRADGMPLLADLGTARVAGERGAVWGTGAAEGMVAPEVLEGFAATAESDVYQLGALARLALTGEPPGPGHDRVPFEEAAPHLDPRLVELVTRCMAPQPEDRPDAEELATVLMGVAVPEPVEVAPDADPAHGLTRRLRQLAQEDAAAQAEEEPNTWWRRPWRRRRASEGEGDGGVVDGEAAGGAVAVRPVGAHRAAPEVGPRSSPWAVAGLFVVSAVVGAALFLGLAGPVRALFGGAVAGEASASTAAPATTSVGGGAAEEAGDGTSATGVPVGTAVDQAAVDQSAVTTTSDSDESPAGADPAPPKIHAHVQSVVDARAAAWEATDPELLVDAVATDSPALAADTAEIERARDGSVSYPRVAFTVEDVEVLERDGDRLKVGATVVRAALEVRDDQGWVLRAPEQVDEVELELVRQDDRWLLWSWTDQVR